MEMSSIKEIRTIDKKNKNAITHKDNSNLTTGLAKCKKRIAIEWETKNGKGMMNTGEGPKEIKQI